MITSIKVYIKNPNAITIIIYGTYLLDTTACKLFYLLKLGVLILALATKNEGKIINTKIPQIPPVKSKTY